MKFFTEDRGDFQTRIAYTMRETADGKQIVVADSDGANAQALTGASINLLAGLGPGRPHHRVYDFPRRRRAHLYS